MIKSTIQVRRQAVKAALGSVRAEGLHPSENIQKDLQAYTQGEETISSIRKDTILRVSNSTITLK